jgi:hypothetical protein
MNRCLCLTGLVWALLALTACAPVVPPAGPTATVPPTATAPPTGTAVPSATASPQPTATPSPEPSPTPTLPPVPPVATAFMLWTAGWSPDGQWLAYRTFSVDDTNHNPVEGTAIIPYGTFHFLNVGTGTGCAYPRDNAYGLQFNLWHAWLPDGRLMTLDQAGAVVALAAPCDGVTAAVLDAASRPACLVTNPDSGQTCSPDGRRLGHTDETQRPRTTTITNTSTGRTEAVITWPYSNDGIGHLPGPAWLDNDRFLIFASDEGPLLVTLGAEVQVQHIAPDLFGLPGTTWQTATGSLIPGTSDFHLLLQDHDLSLGTSHILLYHSESGLVELLSTAYAYLSPNGQWLELRGYDSEPAWLRPVDPPHSEPRQYLTRPRPSTRAGRTIGPGWLSTSNRAAACRPSCALTRCPPAP